MYIATIIATTKVTRVSLDIALLEPMTHHLRKEYEII